MAQLEHDDPIALFSLWFDEARATDMEISNATALATASPDGAPSVRMVLLKGYDERGFVFYTNLASRKAQELTDNPRAALCFHWMPLKRQVRVRGSIEPVTAEEADAYFATRPRESQLGAWASHQSHPMPHAKALEERVAEAEKRFEGRPVPRPDFWSGFRLLPSELEFWVDRDYRLHERMLYVREGAGWQRQRLYP